MKSGLTLTLLKSERRLKDSNQVLLLAHVPTQIQGDIRYFQKGKGEGKTLG